MMTRSSSQSWTGRRDVISSARGAARARRRGGERGGGRAWWLGGGDGDGGGPALDARLEDRRAERPARGLARTSELWVSALEAWPIWIAPSFRNMSRVPMHELKHAESVSTNTGARISDGTGADLWAAGQVSGAVRWRPAASAALSSSTAVER